MLQKSYLLKLISDDLSIVSLELVPLKVFAELEVSVDSTASVVGL